MLRLTKSTVERGLSLLEVDASGVSTALVIRGVLALACCDHCGSRPRILPCDVLPRKRYGLSVIEYQTAAYVEGDKGLRSVAWSLAGERVPAFTTIHGWTEGLGAHALGRAAGEVAGSRPHTALVAETGAHVLETRDVVEPAVDERCYRSEARHERLAAVAHLLLVAVLATGASSPLALASWCALGVGWGLTSPLLFRTGLSSTRLEHVEIQHRARSPPT